MLSQESREVEALLVKEEVYKREALLHVFLPLGYDLDTVIYEPTIVGYPSQLSFHIISLLLLLCQVAERLEEVTHDAFALHVKLH